MAYQRITVDGKEMNVTGLVIVPWLPYNPAAEVATLSVLAICRFDVSGRDPEGDEVFTFNGLEAADRHNWPPTAFRTPAQPHSWADRNRPQVFDMAMGI